MDENKISAVKQSFASSSTSVVNASTTSNRRPDVIQDENQTSVGPIEMSFSHNHTANRLVRKLPGSQRIEEEEEQDGGAGGAKSEERIPDGLEYWKERALKTRHQVEQLEEESTEMRDKLNNDIEILENENQKWKQKNEELRDLNQETIKLRNVLEDMEIDITSCL